MVCCSSYALADAALAQEHPEETEPEFDFVEQTVKVTGINRLWSLVQDHERHKEENNDQMDITIGEKKLKDAFAKYAKVIGTALSTDSVDIDGETWGLITFSHSSSSQLLMLGQQTATVRVDGFDLHVEKLDEALENCAASRNCNERAIEHLSRENAGRATNEQSSDGQIDFDEFIQWYLNSGKFYLSKPSYETLSIDQPSAEERKRIFNEIDQDNSGELDKDEVVQAAKHIWPGLQAGEVIRAFEIADEDHSGLVGLQEFMHLISFIIYFNKQRVSVCQPRPCWRNVGASLPFSAGSTSV